MKKTCFGVFILLFATFSLPTAADVFAIAQKYTSESAVSVVYNPLTREYAVSYSMVPAIYSDGKASINLARVDDDGYTVNSTRLFENDGLHSHNPYVDNFPRTAISYNKYWGEFLVTWDFIHKNERRVTYSMAASIFGNSIGAPSEINRSNTLLDSFHTYNPIEHEYLLAYCVGDSDLFSLPLDSFGRDELGGATKIDGCQMAPSLVLNSGWGEFIALWWRQESGGIVRVYGRRLYRNGQPISATFGLTDWRDALRNIRFLYETTPSGAYNPKLNQYLIVWPQGQEVWGSIIYATGTRRLGPFKVGSGGSPDVTFSTSKNRYIVVYDRAGDIYGMTMSASGTRYNEFKISSSPREDRRPRIAYNQDRSEALVAWVHTFSNYDRDIHGRVITDTGEVK